MANQESFNDGCVAEATVELKAAMTALLKYVQRKASEEGLHSNPDPIHAELVRISACVCVGHTLPLTSKVHDTSIGIDLFLILCVITAGLSSYSALDLAEDFGLVQQLFACSINAIAILPKWQVIERFFNAIPNVFQAKEKKGCHDSYWWCHPRAQLLIQCQR